MLMAGLDNLLAEKGSPALNDITGGFEGPLCLVLNGSGGTDKMPTLKAGTRHPGSCQWHGSGASRRRFRAGAGPSKPGAGQGSLRLARRNQRPQADIRFASARGGRAQGHCRPRRSLRGTRRHRDPNPRYARQGDYQGGGQRCGDGGEGGSPSARAKSCFSATPQAPFWRAATVQLCC